MKRFVLVVVMIALVLASSAAPAFAAACMATRCAKNAPCVPERPVGCPMEKQVPAVTHSKCDPPVTEKIRALPPVPSPADDVAVLPVALVVTPGTAFGPLLAAVRSLDARGAPHLTTVIRI